MEKKGYFFFLVAFFADFLAGAFFFALALAILISFDGNASSA
jgi:hypothetical protein